MQHKLEYQTKMQKTMDCPICDGEIFSGLGKGCRMCGMLLEDDHNNFCCEDCKDKYCQINDS